MSKVGILKEIIKKDLTLDAETPVREFGLLVSKILGKTRSVNIILNSKSFLQNKLENLFNLVSKKIESLDQLWVVLDNQVFSYNDLLDYVKSVDSEGIPLSPEFHLARRLNKAQLSAYVKSLKGVEFDSLTESEKEELLYNLGMDVRSCDKGSVKYVEEFSSHRDFSGKAVEGLCIVANERTDKEWLNSGFASYEAKIYTPDPTLRRDLSQIARGGIR